MKKLFAIAFLLSVAWTAGAQTSSVIVFKGALLIDGTGGPKPRAGAPSLRAE